MDRAFLIGYFLPTLAAAWIVGGSLLALYWITTLISGTC